MTDGIPYGHRFLDACKPHSGTLGSFAYAEIQRMKAAVREAFIKVFRERSSMLPYSTIQLLLECEPEEAARVLHPRAAQSVHTGQISIWMILALT